LKPPFSRARADMAQSNFMLIHKDEKKVSQQFCRFFNKAGLISPKVTLKKIEQISFFD
jgi:hypothetical protein